jgi:hypothetical protein
MLVYEYGLDDAFFYDWPDCPSYVRTTLSEIVKTPDSILRKDAIVNCVVDIDLTYEQSIKLKTQLVKKYGLREINLHENPDQLVALEDTNIDDEELKSLDTTVDLVINMLSKIEADAINNDKLITIFKGL